MRILIVSKYFPPENSVASLRPYSWAKYWSRSGHDVSVLTCVKPENNEVALKTSGIDNFKVYEIDYNPLFYKLQNIYLGRHKERNTQEHAYAESLIVKSNSSLLNIKSKLKKLNEFRLRRGILSGQRMPDTMDLWIKPAVNWGKANGPWDLIVSTYAPYACHIIASKLKKSNLTRFWIADFRDLWTDHHIFKGLFPFTLFERSLEHQLMKQTDFITTVSSPLATTLAERYDRQKVHVIENGFDSEDLKNLPNEKIFKDGKIRIVHTGTIYPGRMDPSLLFDAIASIAADQQTRSLLDRLEVLFVGAYSDKVVAKAVEKNVSDWVKDGGFVSREDVLRMQREAHVLLYLGFDKSKALGLLSGKMYEYMFSKTPIWAIEVNEQSTVGEIFLKANAGILFGEDGKSVREHLLDLLQNPVKIKANVNQEFVQLFERSSLAYKMLSLIDDKI